MKADITKLDEARVTSGQFASPHGAPFGCFFLANPIRQGILRVIFDNGETTGWEHASVCAIVGSNMRSSKEKTPHWDEMNYVKNCFWDEKEAVMQIHPRIEHYVNDHPFVLHLWRPLFTEIPEPNPIMVGLGRKVISISEGQNGQDTAKNEQEGA